MKSSSSTSSSSKPSASSKEEEILKRQRQLAARLAAVSGQPPSEPKTAAKTARTTAAPSRKVVPSGSSSQLKKPPPPPPATKAPSTKSLKTSTTNGTSHHKNNVASMSFSTTTQGPAPAQSASLKRPSKNRSQSSASVTAGKTASAATQKAAAVSSYSIAQSATNDPSPPLKRKTLGAPGTGSGGGTLAHLVPKMMASAMNANSLADLDLHFPTIHPDDFWKHLREWDFVSQYYQALNPPDNNDEDKDTIANKSSSSVAPTTKVIPNVFLNHRHYVAAWAPMCLAECRAQLLQDWMSNGSLEPVLVQVESTHSRVKAHRDRNHSMTGATSGGGGSGGDHQWNHILDEVETGGHVIVRVPRHAPKAPPMSFFSGDICLLIQSKHPTLLADLSRGRKIPPLPGKEVGDYSSVALIGHTESSRSDVNGLILKVSKQKWAKIGQKDMYLFKLGSNVTALREFTALANVETLPMKRYLLGQHLEKKETVKLSHLESSTDQLLTRMGGTQALGEGFIKYAKGKFNASQLTAIAASANEYGEGGFTLIKGPPGTGKTTTLVAVLNSLHIRQYNKYYDEVRRIASAPTGARQAALALARKAKPRLLVTAPSNAAVDNIILKIMQDGFVDGKGQRYNPSMIRVGVGQSNAVRSVSLETKVDAIFDEHMDVAKLDSSIAGFKLELSRITQDIAKLRRRCAAILNACPYPLGQAWEIRVEEDTFDETSRVFFVNHKEMSTTYECPPPPEPGEAQFEAKSMPEYRSFMSRIVKLVEGYFNIKSELERCTIVKSSTEAGANQFEIRQTLESHVLNSVHMVMTTLGTAGNRTLEGSDKFEVVVVDEAAQSVEPSILSALQLGSRHSVLVGDPQQLPATIFNLSGRNSKYDRSLFQRLEEAGQPVYMLNEQYRMHPSISHFPRHIFYSGNLLDGPNVRQPDYGNPLRGIVCQNVPNFQPFVILDLDSMEERGGTSLSNAAEAKLALFLFLKLKEVSRGLSLESRVAVITPYAQQMKLLRQIFTDALGPRYTEAVEINTVDAFQGREASIVIFSAVRAAGSHGIGFLSDVRRMNVALTRAKHFLFVIARCESIVVNPYWSDLVQHAKETNAVLSVPFTKVGNSNFEFGPLHGWNVEVSVPRDPRKRKKTGLTAH